MISPTQLLAQSAQTLFVGRQPLAAAILYAEVVRLDPDEAGYLCGLGSALARSAGILVRKPFLESAARAFLRSKQVGPETDFVDVCDEWLAELNTEIEVAKQPVLNPNELDGLLDFLEVEQGLVERALDEVPQAEAMGLIMGIAGVGLPRFRSVVLEAIKGRWGPAAGRSALKRLGPYQGHPDTAAALAQARSGPLAEELQPYLDWASGTPGEVDAPLPDDEAPPPTKPWWRFW